MNVTNENKKEIHNNALKNLCAIQYYISTLPQEYNLERKKKNYYFSLKCMSEVINILISTSDEINQYNDSDIPVDLLFIYKEIKNLKNQISYIKN